MNCSFVLEGDKWKFIKTKTVKDFDGNKNKTVPEQMEMISLNFKRDYYHYEY